VHRASDYAGPPLRKSSFNDNADDGRAMPFWVLWGRYFQASAVLPFLTRQEETGGHYTFIWLRHLWWVVPMETKVPANKCSKSHHWKIANFTNILRWRAISHGVWPQVSYKIVAMNTWGLPSCN
jgi:hypothetical protein